MSFPKELQKVGKSQKDFEEKRKAFVNAGKASEENDIYLGLYEDLIDECKDYQELEEGYSNMARFLDQLGKESFEFQQKARQARLLGFENEGISKVRIISAECCDSCSEYDGRVIELKKALLNLPMPSSLCGETMHSEYCWSKANYQRVEDSASVSKTCLQQLSSSRIRQAWTKVRRANNQMLKRQEHPEVSEIICFRYFCSFVESHFFPFPGYHVSFWSHGAYLSFLLCGTV